MKNALLRKLSALLLAASMLFSFVLTGCSEKEIETAADIALSVLESLEDEGTSSAASSQISSSEESSKSSSVSSEPASLPPASVSSSAPSSSASAEVPVSSSTAPAEPENENVPAEDSQLAPPAIEEDGWYSTKDEVALYIHTYDKLPENFLTKKEAGNLGWVSSKGNLWDVAPGMSIGGDSFGNREGLLPKKNGRKWYECDINYEGGYRGAERILFSNDGLIYYTDDHYESFEQLY